jgi:pimeloyl-ACP methyl ester carboxylesterase
MGAVQPHRSAALPYRETTPPGAESRDPVVLVHGFPQSSRMWASLMEALADSGRRCLAPDLYGLGDSDDGAPTTFEGNLEAFGRFVDELELGRVAVVVHDWGGFIGLAWACEHPDRVSALVISDTGFFADGRWHGMAEAVRGENGERIVAAIDRSGFEGLLRNSAPFDDDDVEAYWAPFAEGRGQRATLDFYRSMDFSKLAPYEGRLAELGVPTLLLWGAEDEFAPIGGARRFEREIPGARLVVIDDAGHFVFDQQPERCGREVVAFLEAEGG